MITIQEDLMHAKMLINKNRYDFAFKHLNQALSKANKINNLKLKHAVNSRIMCAMNHLRGLNPFPKVVKEGNVIIGLFK